MRDYIESLNPLEFYQPMGQRELVLAHAWGIRVNEVTYRVPAHMETDGASIPRFFWRIIDPPFYSLLTPAAILHDAAYGGILRATSDEDDWLPVEKDEADWLLGLVGEWNGFPLWKCRAAYTAVRQFGGIAWRNGHRRNEGLDLRAMEWQLVDEGKQRGDTRDSRGITVIARSS